MGNPDPLEALEARVGKLIDAGEFELAKRIMDHVEARRRERAGVVDLGEERAKRGSPR